MGKFEFNLPELGEGVTEGEIVKWLVKAGDVVTEDTPVVEIMTDKATVSVPTPHGGRVLKTYGETGDVARVHGRLVDFETDREPASEPKSEVVNPPAPPAPVKSPAGGQSKSQPKSVSATPPAPAKSPAGGQSEPQPKSVSATPPAPAKSPAGGQSEPQREGVSATPLTRRMAREHGVELSDVSGSGAQGRVLKADVEAYLATQTKDQRIPLRGLRKIIAAKLVKSKQTVPHYTFVEEVDATQLIAIRKRLNAHLKSDKLTFLPFFIKAVVAAFRKFPNVCATMDEAAQELVVHSERNISIATMTPMGLTVPVVHGAQSRSLPELSAEVSRLAEAARAQRLRPEELTGGTFTISSLGPTGGLMATPIINHPEVAIMGIHRLSKRAVVDENDAIVVRQMLNLSFAFDHRVIDGAVGADFAYEVIRFVEAPELLLLDATA